MEKSKGLTSVVAIILLMLLVVAVVTSLYSLVGDLFQEPEEIQPESIKINTRGAILGEDNLKLRIVNTGDKAFNSSSLELRITEFKPSRALKVSRFLRENPGMISPGTGPKDGLKAFYKMDSGSGQKILDTEGSQDGFRGSNSLSESSDPSWSTDCVTESCLEFDDNDKVRIPRTDYIESVMSNSNLSISFWVKPENQVSDWDDIISWSGEMKDGTIRKLRTETERTFTHPPGDQLPAPRSIYTRWIAWEKSCGYGVDNSGFWYRENDMGVIPEKWNHYAVTYDGDQTTEYVNGKRIGSSIDNCELANMVSDLFIEPSDLSFSIDNLYLYNRTLTKGEVKRIFHAGDCFTEYNYQIIQPQETYTCATGIESPDPGTTLNIVISNKAGEKWVEKCTVKSKEQLTC